MLEVLGTPSETLLDLIVEHSQTPLKVLCGHSILKFLRTWELGRCFANDTTCLYPTSFYGVPSSSGDDLIGIAPELDSYELHKGAVAPTWNATTYTKSADNEIPMEMDKCSPGLKRTNRDFKHSLTKVQCSAVHEVGRLWRWQVYIRQKISSLLSHLLERQVV